MKYKGTSYMEKEFIVKNIILSSSAMPIDKFLFEEFNAIINDTLDMLVKFFILDDNWLIEFLRNHQCSLIAFKRKLNNNSISFIALGLILKLNEREIFLLFSFGWKLLCLLLNF